MVRSQGQSPAQMDGPILPSPLPLPQMQGSGSNPNLLAGLTGMQGQGWPPPSTQQGSHSAAAAVAAAAAAAAGLAPGQQPLWGQAGGVAGFAAMDPALAAAAQMLGFGGMLGSLGMPPSSVASGNPQLLPGMQLAMPLLPLPQAVAVPAQQQQQQQAGAPVCVAPTAAQPAPLGDKATGTGSSPEEQTAQLGSALRPASLPDPGRARSNDPTGEGGSPAGVPGMLSCSAEAKRYAKSTTVYSNWPPPAATPNYIECVPPCLSVATSAGSGSNPTGNGSGNGNGHYHGNGNGSSMNGSVHPNGHGWPNNGASLATHPRSMRLPCCCRATTHDLLTPVAPARLAWYQTSLASYLQLIPPPFPAAPVAGHTNGNGNGNGVSSKLHLPPPAPLPPGLHAGNGNGHGNGHNGNGHSARGSNEKDGSGGNYGSGGKNGDTSTAHFGNGNGNGYGNGHNGNGHSGYHNGHRAFHRLPPSSAHGSGGNGSGGKGSGGNGSGGNGSGGNGSGGNGSGGNGSGGNPPSGGNGSGGNGSGGNGHSAIHDVAAAAAAGAGAVAAAAAAPATAPQATNGSGDNVSGSLDKQAMSKLTEQPGGAAPGGQPVQVPTTACNAVVGQVQTAQPAGSGGAAGTAAGAPSQQPPAGTEQQAVHDHAVFAAMQALRTVSPCPDESTKLISSLHRVP